MIGTTKNKQVPTLKLSSVELNDMQVNKKSLKEFDSISAISLRSSKESINAETARFKDDKGINFEIKENYMTERSHHR